MAAATALFCLWGTNAAALSLGRITIQSALGEPLRAEIDVPDINADEAASLKASVALPEAFRAAGLEYNPAMASLQATLQRRADGRAFIRLTGDRAINDPFVDMILEARWASGRIVRDYTMLFDPPKARQAAPTQAQVPAQPSVSSRPAAPAPAVTAPSAPAMSAAEPRAIAPRSVVGVTEPIAPINRSNTVPIKPGDTAGKIAAATKPGNVSLDQMLVAILRANPDAFIGDNVNRVKAGAIINVPTAEQASATPPAEANRIIVAQSRDFNEFRRKLAGSAPSIQTTEADRQASGRVQAQVEDKKPLTTAPDKLTLSKGAVQAKAAEEQLATARNAKEAADRAAEISRNISELGKLGAASSAAPPALAASGPAPAPAPPQTAITAAVTPVLPASAPNAASSAAVVPKLAASAVAKPVTPLPVVPAETSLLDQLIENPLIPAGAFGLIVLLAALGAYRIRQRRNASQVDSVFLESRLRPDSFFGASGGQSVDTNDSAVTGSSMVYSPSQLDAVDDVDPVAEADVYLAYGRDMQAEEILKDALRTNPGRIAIYKKLLEIFAKRRDTLAFEATATQAFKLTSEDAAEWDRICELGLSIDPTNPLYQPGGQPDAPDATPSRPAALDYNFLSPQSEAPVATLATGRPGAEAVELDLDLDFSLDEDPTNTIIEAKAARAEPSSGFHSSDFPAAAAVDMDFGMDTAVIQPVAAPHTQTHANAVEFSLPDLDISDDDQAVPAVDSETFKRQAATSFGATAPAPLPSADTPVEEHPSQDLSMLEFDLGSLSLDLGDSVEAETAVAPEVHEDPLVTKLALAEEFRAIGDDDGARSLIEEVISEASGDMKAKAQRALGSL